MATLSINTLDEELITCQICLYEFDEENKKPKFLQCSHTICLECFQAARQRDTISCPFCRQCTSNADSSGAEWVLPTNQYVLELLRLNRTESNSVPSTASVRESVEEEDEELMLALAMSASETEEFSAFIETMHSSSLNQQQEQVYTSATAIFRQTADEDEQLRLALEMSGREMEQEASNEAMRQQQRVRRSRDRPMMTIYRNSQENTVAYVLPLPSNTPLCLIQQVSTCPMRKCSFLYCFFHRYFTMPFYYFVNCLPSFGIAYIFYWELYFCWLTAQSVRSVLTCI